VIVAKSKRVRKAFMKKGFLSEKQLRGNPNSAVSI
jgi:hypothetical protein